MPRFPQNVPPTLDFSRWITRSLRALALSTLFLFPYAFSQGEKPVPIRKNIETSTLNQLEALRDKTQAELDQLANFNLRGGIGTICFRSMPQDDEFSDQWVQINLDQEYSIQEIALIPAIWRDNENGHRNDGFPIVFKILAGTDQSQAAQLITTIEADETMLPRVAPLIIPCNDIKASWIRIEADQLSRRFHDQLHILQFSEAMIFSNSENVALHQKVTASSQQLTGTGAYHTEHLVDGFLPYLMDGAIGQKSNPYLSGFNIGENPTLTIDLERSQAISEIRIHTIEQGDTVPHALPPNFGVPEHLIFEGSNQADFSDAAVLWDYQPKNLFQIAPVVPKRIDASHAYRYIRLRSLRPFDYSGFNSEGTPTVGTRIGFAELELFSGNKNVALGKTFTPSYDTTNHDPNRPLSRLTDGHNIFGQILPAKEWISQLARRHDLEFQLPLIEQAIQSRYEDQKATLRMWVGIAAVLAALIIIVFLTDRNLRQKAIFRTRERIAADLHDELGANLHAIALLGDLALSSKDSPEKSGQNIERIRALVRRTGEAVKYCTNMLDTPGLYQNLPQEMKQIARRLMADLDHTLHFEGEDKFEQIRPRKRIDLFLFYKESLINILRHSQATEANSKLSISDSKLELSITDNGQGISKANPEPPSLKRRARLIGGKLSVGSSSENGTRILLEMNI